MDCIVHHIIHEDVTHQFYIWVQNQLEPHSLFESNCSHLSLAVYYPKFEAFITVHGKDKSYYLKNVLDTIKRYNPLVRNFKVSEDDEVSLIIIQVLPRRTPFLRKYAKNSSKAHLSKEMTILFLVYVYVLLLNFSMFNIVQYPNDTHFLKPLGLLGAGVLVHEVISQFSQLITYPFERMASRSIATQTGRQLSAVWREEGVRGLYRGLSIGIGRSVMQHVSHYFIF